ncbi:unnamed protein product [Prorocentrum cordatum]|uniref:Uncharacterized protein n=1 Tax=Prorocentrum cordatum TaxID=2364126 RepID=A0ABN9TXU2_9DINO|nr:unnamed protein product [Polarella glacialis]
MGPAGSDAAEARAPRPLAVDGGGAQHKTNSRGPRRGLGAQVPRRRGGEAGRGQTPSRGDGITAGFWSRYLTTGVNPRRRGSGERGRLRRNGALLRWGGAGAEAEAERAARLSAGAARRGAVPGRPRPPLRRGRAAARGPCDAAAAGGPAAGHGRGGRVRSCAGAGGQRWAGPCGEGSAHLLLVRRPPPPSKSCSCRQRLTARAPAAPPRGCWPASGRA